MAELDEYERLYPSLPSVNFPTLVLSSDEEEDMKNEYSLHRNNKDGNTSRVVQYRDHVTEKRDNVMNSSFCHSAVSLSDFETSYFRPDKVSNPNPLKKKEKTLPAGRKTSVMTLEQALSDIGKWVWSVLYKWKVVFIGILMGFVVVMSLDKEDRRGKLGSIIIILKISYFYHEVKITSFDNNCYYCWELCIIK